MHNYLQWRIYLRDTTVPLMKKEIESKIKDIDKMMDDLGLDDLETDTPVSDKSNIDINGLDVLEVLNNILN